MPFFPQSASTKARRCASLRSTMLFFPAWHRQQDQNRDSSPVGAPAAINVRWKACLLKWNSTLAVRTHLRARRSSLRRKVFQWCHFARLSWAASTQTLPSRLHFICTLCLFALIYSLISTWTSAATVKNGRWSWPIVFSRQAKSHPLGTQTSPLSGSPF